MRNQPPGQMTDHERDVLQNEIWLTKPSVVFEVGTWYGGGSTFQIMSGLIHNSKGILHTWESLEDRAKVAADFYSNSYWQNRFFGHVGSMRSHLPAVINQHGAPDFIFFDGGEDPNEAMDDIRALEPYLKPNTVLAMHDWLHAESHKCDLIKPYLESGRKWSIYGLITPPASVGLVFARFNGN